MCQTLNAKYTYVDLYIQKQDNRTFVLRQLHKNKSKNIPRIWDIILLLNAKYT